MATILITDKVGFKTRIIAREKDGHFLKRQKGNKSEWFNNYKGIHNLKEPPNTWNKNL